MGLLPSGYLLHSHGIDGLVDFLLIYPTIKWCI